MVGGWLRRTAATAVASGSGRVKVMELAPRSCGGRWQPGGSLLMVRYFEHQRAPPRRCFSPVQCTKRLVERRFRERRARAPHLRSAATHSSRQHAHQPPTALVTDAMARRLTKHHLPRHSSTTHYHGAKPRTISRCAHAVTKPCRHPCASFPRCEVLGLRGSRPGRAVTVYNQQQPRTPPAPTHLLAYASTAR